MDGITPTVNIVSEGMKGKVAKALTRKEMLNHPIFKGWISSPFQKEAYVRGIVKENSRDSKKRTTDQISLTHVVFAPNICLQQK